MAEEVVPPTEQLSRKSVLTRLNALREWTAASRLRGIAAGAGLLVVVLATVGTWLYLATLTVATHLPSLADALEAYDADEFDEARLLVVRMTEDGSLMPDEYGGPLFVLGAVKATEADEQWSALLRQSQYSIAAKYLQEAKAVGFPPGREAEGNYLLGRSMIESGDNMAGLQVLERALEESDGDHLDLHLTLASAYVQGDPPLYQAALGHIDTVLDSPSLDGERRVRALLDRLDVLSKLGRFNEARATLQATQQDQVSPSQALLAAARIDIDELRHHLTHQLDTEQRPQKLYDAVEESIAKLARISPADEAAEEAMYLTGVAQGLLGKTNNAIRQYERVRKLFASTPAGIAASVAEGDLYREKRRDDAQALTAYRRSLSALDSPQAYRNRFLPLNELRQRMLAAHADFLVAMNTPPPRHWSSS